MSLSGGPARRHAGRWARSCAVVALLIAGTGVGTAARAQDLPTYAQTRSAHPVSDLQLLDRRGEPLQTLRVDATRRVLAWVTLDQMSPSLLRAMLLSEDQRFYAHSGVDWSAVAASAWANLWNTRTRGASTVTMQLAGLLDEDLARRGGRSLRQKLGQVWVASRLEQRWTKAQILEAYLNRVPLRGELVGVPAAAQALFGKRPSGLDAREAALLAAMLRGPNVAPEALASRACGVLRAMGQACDGLVDEIAAVLRRKPLPLADSPQWAPHFARLALREGGGPTRRSTLDAVWQRTAVLSLRRHLAELADRQVEDGAVVALDNDTGEVRVWVGSSGSQLSESAQVDHVLARRQPGSTLKPFLYELALERRLITAASLLDDSPAQVATSAGLYLPQNYDKQYRGWISARASLGNSLNIPAVRLSLMLTPEAVFDRLNALGLALPETGGFYGPSLALGSADVTLLGLTNAYRALANGGRYGEVRLPTEKADRVGRPRQVADPRATFIVGDMLADNNARALTFGLSSALALPFPASVKTGTSKDMRDNWCIGWTQRFTVGVWVGNSSGEAMQQVSGVSGAAPVWREVMLALHAGKLPRPAEAPAGVLQQAVRFDGGQEPPRPEWFVAGTEQAVIRIAEPSVALSNPTDGAIYALDPDIPPTAQRLRFSHAGRLPRGATASWRLDGRVIGKGATLDWLPMPGRHELALLDGRGQVLQQVRFEVRGAGLRAGPHPANPQVKRTKAQFVAEPWRSAG